MPRFAVRVGAFFVGLFFIACADAASLQVSPVRVNLSAESSTAAIKVENASAEATSVQLEVLAWSQNAGAEEYAPTRDILATPPLFTLPAGGSQIVRLGLLQAPAPDKETSYRLFLQELPGSKSSGNQVQFTMRISIPLFVAPADGIARSDIEWKAEKLGSGKLQVQAFNRGNKHLQLSGIQLRLAEGGATFADIREMKYLLPGQGYQWQMRPSGKLPNKGRTLLITAHTDEGILEAQAPF